MANNRAQRRHLKANAGRIAHTFANHCRSAGGDGKFQSITDPRAILVLTRAFKHMLQNGLEDHTTRLTYTQAGAFPGPTPKEIEGVHPYLSVGLDIGGFGTYSLIYATTPGAPHILAETCNRRFAEQSLQPHKAYPGFAHE